MSGVLRFDQLDTSRQSAIKKNLATLQARGASDAEIETYLRDDEKLAPAEPFAGPTHGAGRTFGDEPGKTASLLSGGVDAASFGFSDEIGSFAPAVANLLTGDVAGAKKALASRKSLAQQLVRRTQEAEHANPKTFLAGELGASIAAAPKAVARLGAIGAGAAFGAASGAGHAEGDLVDRGVGAAVGGTVGAGVGAAAEKIAAPIVGYAASKAAPYVRPVVERAAPVVRDAASRLLTALEERGVGLSTRDVGAGAQPVNAMRGRSLLAEAANKVRETADAFAPLTARERAQELLLKNIARDEMTVGNLIADAQTLPERSPMALMDLAGENVRGVARGTRAVPSKGKTLIPRALKERAEGEHARARAAVEDAAGTTAGDPELVTQELVARTRENAKPVYEKAYAQPPIEDPNVLALFKDEAFQDAYDTAKRLAKREGVTLPEALTRETEVGGQRLTEQVPIPVQGFDYVKRALDDVIERRMNAGKIGRSEARQIRNMLSDALNKVDEIVPEYKAARAQFRGDKEMEAAAEAGQEFLTTDDRAVDRLVKGYTPGEREVYAQMALNAIDKHIRATGDTHDVYNRIFGNQLKRDALKALVGDEAFQGLKLEMEGIQRRTETRRFVTGGSNTVDKLGEQLDLETPGIPTAVMDLLKGNPLKASQSLGTSILLNRLKGITGETADELADMTTAGMRGDRTKLFDVLTELQQARQRLAAREAARKGIAPVTRALSGKAAGATSPKNR